MCKPTGAICNLDCTYCYYLEKERLFPSTQAMRMSPAVLESFVRQYIESQDTQEVTFAWQGGEPTLLGVDYFREAVRLQKKYAAGRTVTNAFQTNGTLLDDTWGAFFKENKFLVGISVDGPRALHDAYRLDKRQRPTFDRVLAGVKVLKRHAVDFNTLTVVNRRNVEHALEVYEFLRDLGSTFLQLIPLVERKRNEEARELGLDLATPPRPGEPPAPAPVTSWSVPSEAFGDFLIAIFDAWVRRDVGRIFVNMFDTALANWMGVPGGMCVFAETCGRALALEHNGDLFACDHYVYPSHRLGNITTHTLGDMVNSPAQHAFGTAKRDTLPRYCRECPVLFACRGECPKHRFLRTPDGEPGLNYLCAGYKKFFLHIDPWMKQMADLVRGGQPAAGIMDTFRKSGPAARP